MVSKLLDGVRLCARGLTNHLPEYQASSIAQIVVTTKRCVSEADSIEAMSELARCCSCPVWIPDSHGFSSALPVCAYCIEMLSSRLHACNDMLVELSSVRYSNCQWQVSAAIYADFQASALLGIVRYPT